MLIGWKVAFHEDVRIAKCKWRVKLKGSYLTLVGLLLFFCIQYIFGYLHSVIQVVQYEVLLLESLTGGLFTGYFMGKIFAYFYMCKKRVQ